ncbi:MAG: M28 family peptidase [Anaerolineaceae bacterium]|nr:M28 family peptidase [Anaerolineaceae bacterium]
MHVSTAPARKDLEETLLATLSADAPWSLIEHFANENLIRESGSEDERGAAQYISDQLSRFGVEHTVHTPELFLSVPVRSRLVAGGREFHAKSPAFSISTPPDGLSGEAIFIPDFNASRGADLFDFIPATEDVEVAGKIVVVNGFGGPPPVSFFEERGAIGQIYLNPGENIHWGICTTIWGAPDLDNYRSQPHTPVLAINQSDGEALLAQLAAGETQVTLHTELREGWVECPCIDAVIRGNEEAERFVLVHGHLDSWDIGIGDNAVGNATLLELARIFQAQRDQLARSLRVVWWTGHSTGRYGASTWFADRFGLELARHCIAQVNIDSPGCRWADTYTDVTMMTEASEFACQAIEDASGIPATGARPHQAGDYSFNNIGLSAFFMLLSSMSAELREEKGYYGVGGCGGNIAWHTEDDRLEIADQEVLMRDLRVYTAALQRVLNNPLHPYDFGALAQEFAGTLARYSEAAGEQADFGPAHCALSGLQEALGELYGAAAGLAGRGVGDTAVRAFNDAQLALARELVPINFTRKGRFRTEPAVPIPQLPDLAAALTVAGTSGHLRNVTKTHLLRGVNRVAWCFEQATAIARRAAAEISG